MKSDSSESDSIKTENMMNSGKLAGYTVFITGASRGIGKAIAIKAARDGANVVVAAKTAEPHPKLPGTIYTAAKEIEDAGGRCLPCVVDVRDERMVKAAVDETVRTFGGIDILVNNASAISLTGTLATPMKKYDLMNQINARGTYLCSQTALPHLIESKKQGRTPHILNMSPPISLKPIWFKNHTAYSIAKMGMSMCVLGMAAEFKDMGVAVNALWPKTTIITAAMEMLAGDSVAAQCRTPDIMADAAYAMLTKPSHYTGFFGIDEKILEEEGITNFDQYAVSPGTPLILDFFLEDTDMELKSQLHQKATSAAYSNKIADVFQKVEATLTKDIVGSTSGVFKFVVADETWILDLARLTIKEGDGVADVVMTMNGADFKDLFQGKLNATAAYMQGKLKISGNVMLAMQLERLMAAINK